MTFCSIRFSFGLHIYLMLENLDEVLLAEKSFSNLEQPTKNWDMIQRTVRTKKKTRTGKNLTPCFKYKPSPTLLSPEPLYGFKYNP